MSKKPKKKISLPPHYDSIDTFPILSWERLHQKKDMVHLLIKPVKLTKAQKIELSKVWTAIYNEYIRVFGFEDNYKSILEKQAQKLRLQYKYIISGEKTGVRDKTILNFIRHKDKEIEALKNMNKGSKGDVFTAKMAIEKKMGYQLNLHRMSVREFYTYLKELK